MKSNLQVQEKVQEKALKSSKIKAWLSEKEKLSHEFIENEKDVYNKKIYTGDIYDCEVGENIGNEQSNKRPVLVISKSFYNHHSTQVTVIPLSETVSTRVIVKQGQRKTVLKTRTHYLLKKKHFPFLNADSVVKCEQIRSISKSRLQFKLGKIDVDTMNKVKKRVSDLLDI